MLHVILIQMYVVVFTWLHHSRFGPQIGQVDIGLSAINDWVGVLAGPICSWAIRHGHLTQKGDRLWLLRRSCTYRWYFPVDYQTTEKQNRESEKWRRKHSGVWVSKCVCMMVLLCVCVSLTAASIWQHTHIHQLGSLWLRCLNIAPVSMPLQQPKFSSLLRCWSSQQFSTALFSVQGLQNQAVRNTLKVNT